MNCPQTIFLFICLFVYLKWFMEVVFGPDMLKSMNQLSRQWKLFKWLLQAMLAPQWWWKLPVNSELRRHKCILSSCVSRATSTAELWLAKSFKGNFFNGLYKFRCHSHMAFKNRLKGTGSLGSGWIFVGEFSCCETSETKFSQAVAHHEPQPIC